MSRRRPRYLIVNADDFGQSPGVNRGIIEAHERGIVTSASLMVRWPAAVDAAAYSRKHPELSLGLHFDFGEWACRNGTWEKLYEVVPEDDISAVAEEASRQLATFRRLVGRDPTHIDSHQHAHRAKSMRSLFVEIARQHAVPLRGVSPEVHYSGKFYGQNDEGWPFPECISVDAFITILAELPPGFVELGCHPGAGNDLDSMYLGEREQEVKALCDPRVRAAIADMKIELCSFRDVVVRWADTRLRTADRRRARHR
ncbi:MAG TPA: ChbG/HpnK family deacetylase [Myxococcaceae bacterium]|nr:ChbG/HpnK family deacetylase [Myxococcaceae bacterium]